MDMDELKDKVAAVFGVTEHQTGYRNFTVEVSRWKDGTTVKVSQMYDFLPLTFKIFEQLAEIFGTRDFKVDQWSSSGCATCDHGSQYTHEFEFKNVGE